MLSGKGFYRGSSILVSGTAGTGKSTLAAHFVDAACSAASMHSFLPLKSHRIKSFAICVPSVSILRRFVKKGLLKFQNARPVCVGTGNTSRDDSPDDQRL